MLKSKPKRKTRSDKLPLTLHPTGEFCKKIRGRSYYFGSDKQKALERYLEQAVFLHTGKQSKPQAVNQEMSIRTLCNLYLDHQQSRAKVGEIRRRHV